MFVRTERPLEFFVPGIEKALRYGDGSYTTEDVLRRVREGSAQLWAEGDSLLVTEITNTPTGLAVHLWLATGGIDELLALSRRVLDWGRSVGCARALVSGRRGWERVCRHDGWRPIGTVLEQKL